jgi:hypothetical protein
MSEPLRRRAHLLAYAWFRLNHPEAAHPEAWRFCQDHWHAFAAQVPGEPPPAPEDAPVQLVF